MQTKVAISTFMFFHLALPAAAAVNHDVLRNLVTTSRRMTNCFSLYWNLCCLANTTVHSQAGENASNVFLASLLIKTIKIFLCQLSAHFLSPKELAAFEIGNSFVDYRIVASSNACY